MMANGDWEGLLSAARCRAAAELARPHFAELGEALRRCGLNEIGALHFSQDDEDGLNVEWIFPECRMLMNFETDPAESGWCFASRMDTGAGQSWGYLDSLDVPALVERTARSAGVWRG
ncbi:hypothetical protein WMF38_57600 [Sorangium sp. So ce118]